MMLCTQLKKINLLNLSNLKSIGDNFNWIVFFGLTTINLLDLSNLTSIGNDFLHNTSIRNIYKNKTI